MFLLNKKYEKEFNRDTVFAAKKDKLERHREVFKKESVYLEKKLEEEKIVTKKHMEEHKYDEDEER